MTRDETVVVPRGVHRIADQRARLSAPMAAPEPLTDRNLAGLPEPAVRWLTHVVAPGTPEWSTARVTMVGQLRLGRWWPFSATQIVRPGEGHVWAADVRHRPGAHGFRDRDIVGHRWWSRRRHGPLGYRRAGRHGVVAHRPDRSRAGVTLPEHLRAGWWAGTARQDEGEFFRATITAATFR